jgi:hypothetical protein
VAPLEGFKEVGLVSCSNAVELIRLVEGCCLEKAVPPAKGCGERHIALIRRPSKRKPLFEGSGHRQPLVLLPEVSQWSPGERIQGPAAGKASESLKVVGSAPSLHIFGFAARADRILYEAGLNDENNLLQILLLIYDLTDSCPSRML